MNLLVALRAIRVEGRLLTRNQPKVDMVGTVMPRMAAQAEERRLLLQQFLGHSAVRIVADQAILRHRRMLIHPGSLLRRVTFVAGQIDRRLLQEFVARAAVGIMALGADHFAFRHWVVERQPEQAGDLRVTPIAHPRLLDRHRQPFRPIHLGMVDVHELRPLVERMRVVAIGAGY